MQHIQISTSFLITKSMVIILMGVSGSGKTTVGELLARDTGWYFYDADDFHPKANIDKMRQGIPLTDADREPWLDTLHQLLQENIRKGQSVILACSALKRSYREYLLRDNKDAHIIYLKGEYDLIQKRLEERQGHYMKANLLTSQFNTLEEPENALIIDVAQEPEAIVKRIKRELGL